MCDVPTVRLQKLVDVAVGPELRSTHQLLRAIDDRVIEAVFADVFRDEEQHVEEGR